MHSQEKDQHCNTQDTPIVDDELLHGWKGWTQDTTVVDDKSLHEWIQDTLVVDDHKLNALLIHSSLI